MPLTARPSAVSGHAERNALPTIHVDRRAGRRRFERNALADAVVRAGDQCAVT
jgi:hypothetical protein